MKKLVLATLALCLALPIFTFAQTINATLGGTVSDASGALIPGVTLTATSSSSVGSVLPDSKIKDLPLVDRNVLGLVTTQAGVQMGGMAGGDLQAPAIFAGTRGTNVNTSRDGVSVNDTRHNDSGGFSVTYTSPDLVEEVRVIVAAADAEMGRGGGQVQIATPAGTNQYRGSVFYTNRNSILDVNHRFYNFTV